MVAKSIVFHVNSYEIVQSWSWKAKNTRYFLGVEKICSLVPVNPHASKIIAEKVIKWVSRKKTQTVWNPVGFIARVIEIGLCTFSEITDSLCTLFICARPDPKSNSV